MKDGRNPIYLGGDAQLSAKLVAGDMIEIGVVGAELAISPAAASDDRRETLSESKKIGRDTNACYAGRAPAAAADIVSSHQVDAVQLSFIMLDSGSASLLRNYGNMDRSFRRRAPIRG
jgi:hypothetical protein